MMLKGPKAPKDPDDTKAWERYDREWFWYSVKWYSLCVVGALVTLAELALLFRVVFK